MNPPEDASELESWQIKEMLMDIEVRNEPREAINFLSVCNEDAPFCGEKGSIGRRLFQQKWQLIKRKDTHSHLSLLQDCQVQPGTHTQKMLRITTPNKKKKIDQGTTEENGGCDAGDIVKDLTKLKIEEDGNQNKNDGFDEFVGSVTNPPSSFASPIMRSNSQNEKTVSDFRCYQGNGTQNKPHDLHVDVNHPERNREFNIQHVQKMKRGNHECNGFHIRIASNIVDCKKWKCHAPEQFALPKTFRSMCNRILMVSGPSVSFWLSDKERYHAHKALSCQATEDAHCATAIAIRNDGNRAVFFFVDIS